MRRCRGRGRKSPKVARHGEYAVGTARRGSPGLLALRAPGFGNFTDRRVEVELPLVPLCSGCEKGSSVHTVREQSCVAEMYFIGFHLKH